MSKYDLWIQSSALCFLLFDVVIDCIKSGQINRGHKALKLQKKAFERSDRRFRKFKAEVV